MKHNITLNDVKKYMLENEREDSLLNEQERGELNDLVLGAIIDEENWAGEAYNNIDEVHPEEYFDSMGGRIQVLGYKWLGMDMEDDDDGDWGYNEDEGFDPYEGSYTYDC